MLCLYVVGKVYKTFMQSRLTALMIAQAYLSTVTMFASLYVITYRINVSTSSCSYMIVYVQTS